MTSKILGLLAMGLLAGPMVAQSASVIVGGKEWRQPADTFGSSWDDTAAICDPTTGVCSGTLSGWTWASNNDIQALFERLIRPGTTEFPTPTSNYSELNSVDIDTAFSPGYFDPTYHAFGVFEFVRGWSRTLAVPHVPGVAQAYSPYLQHYIGSEPADQCLLEGEGPPLQCPDQAVLSEQRDTTQTFIGGGVWLYRPAPPAQSLELLYSAVIGIGPGRSLANKVAIVQAYLAVPDTQSACLTLDDFKNEVRAQRGKTIPLALADQLTADASDIELAIPCP
jgi:hypothetical protein